MRPLAQPLRLARPSRAPMLLVGGAFAAGIVADATLRVAGTTWLLAALPVSFVLALVIGLRWHRAAALLLLPAIALTGAVRHHAERGWAAPRHVARFARDQRQLVRLRGRVVREPEIRRRPLVSRSSWPEFDRTLAVVAAEEIVATDGAVTAVAGRVQLSVSGHLPDIRVGDRIAFFGWMARPRSARNPGEFDYREWLASRGIRVTCWTNHPDAVRRLGPRPRWSFPRWLADWRRAVEWSIRRDLPVETAPVAAALLVGSRSDLPDDDRDAFATSGTLHLLAISGLHVGILAGFLWVVVRVCGLHGALGLVVLVVTMLGYMLLTGARPSVVRATVFVFVATLGRPLRREAAPLQVLAIAAILLLLWRPTDLFDTGAQLSFLAAAAIALAIEWRSRPRTRETPIDDLVERGPLASAARSAVAGVVASMGTMAVIWGMTAPLVAHRFHLIAPVGLLVNVVLVPWLLVVMVLGYVYLGSLVVGAAFSTAWGSGIAASLFGASLDILLNAVRLAGSWRMGHVHSSGPAGWWTVGFYLGAGLLVLLARRHRWPARVVAVLLVWIVVGLHGGSQANRSDGLRCTFLSVGHGNAVLLQLPNGRTLLYDGGSLSGPEYAERVIRSAVWDAGRSHLDAALVSHADVDHFNAVSGLVKSVAVRELLLSQPFLDFEQRFVTELCEAAADHGTTIRLVHAGDEVSMCDGVRLAVLHPPPGTTFESDNAASTVLLVEYAGRRILLTGDIERDGLERLLAEPPVTVDVLESPHHGSRAANTSELATWADPEVLVVSAGPRTRLDHLEETFPAARLLTTREQGAITVQIARDGRIDCRGWAGRDVSSSR